MATRAQTRQYVRDHRARKKDKVLFDDLHPKIQARLVKDMQWRIDLNERGNYVVHWDYSEETRDFLMEYAEVKGVTLNDLIGHCSREMLRMALALAEQKMKLGQRRN